MLGTKYPEILPGWNLEIEFILNCLDIYFDVTQFHGGVFTLKDLGLNNTMSASNTGPGYQVPGLLLFCDSYLLLSADSEV